MASSDPLYFVGQQVWTPFGRGAFVGVRHSDPLIYEVRPLDWYLDRGQKPTFYLNPKDVKPWFSAGDEVFCAYGEGQIDSYRANDTMYIVHLKNWKLATGKSPIIYMQEQNFWKPKKQSWIEAGSSGGERKKESYTEDCITAALKCKGEATELFKASNFEAAKLKYLEALRALQYVEDDATNEQKAKVFEQTVPCHNNVAICSMQSKNYSDCVLFATNGLTLIVAMEERIPDGLVWQSSLDLGLTEEKLLKDWKKKSYYLMGKAELMRKEYVKASAYLDAALKLIATDAGREKEKSELQTLLATASKKKAEELKREKNTWSKAFEKNKVVADAAEAAAAAASKSHAPPPPPPPLPFATASTSNYSSFVSSSNTEQNSIDLTKPGLFDAVFANGSSSKGVEPTNSSNNLATDADTDAEGDADGPVGSWEDSLVGAASLSAVIGLLGLGAYYLFKRR